MHELLSEAENNRHFPGERRAYAQGNLIIRQARLAGIELPEGYNTFQIVDDLELLDKYPSVVEFAEFEEDDDPTDAADDADDWGEMGDCQSVPLPDVSARLDFLQRLGLIQIDVDAVAFTKLGTKVVKNPMGNCRWCGLDAVRDETGVWRCDECGATYEAQDGRIGMEFVDPAEVKEDLSMMASCRTLSNYYEMLGARWDAKARRLIHDCRKAGYISIEDEPNSPTCYIVITKAGKAAMTA